MTPRSYRGSSVIDPSVRQHGKLEQSYFTGNFTGSTRAETTVSALRGSICLANNRRELGGETVLANRHIYRARLGQRPATQTRVHIVPTFTDTNIAQPGSVLRNTSCEITSCSQCSLHHGSIAGRLQYCDNSFKSNKYAL